MPLLTEDIMNDDEILITVYTNFDSKPDLEEENEEPIMSLVSLSEALNALHILIQFQKQQDDSNGFKQEELKMSRKKMAVVDVDNGIVIFELMMLLLTIEFAQLVLADIISPILILQFFIKELDSAFLGLLTILTSRGLKGEDNKDALLK
ncbi:14229_t:CDS:2 [Acaulospora morrowiae]|uniref:14229_t:CDS:1 n=1 Tax=Acaulospora morrowiae TaxID=94023 RepID=A0A9N8V9R0_9GLOM|nr:14229_t:CDS:2 [Acaulospora morrowiae]